MSEGCSKEEIQVGQAITDYARFLAEARDAVYRLNCDQNTASQLAAQEDSRVVRGRFCAFLFGFFLLFLKNTVKNAHFCFSLSVASSIFSQQRAAA